MATRNTIHRDSVEYARVPVTAPPGISLGSQTVEVACVDTGTVPVSGDWETATWDGSSVKFLIGTAPLDLAPGTYRVWVRISSAPETPVLTAGTIRVT